MSENEKFSLSPNMFLSKQKENSNINLIYIYYYIKIENEKIFNDNFIKGAGPPMINKDMYYDINIPIPSIETQNHHYHSNQFLPYNMSPMFLMRKTMNNHFLCVSVLK